MVSPGPDVVAQSAATSGVIQVLGSGVAGGVKTISNLGVGSLEVSLGTDGTGSEAVGSPSTNVTMLQLVLKASSAEGVSVKGHSVFITASVYLSSLKSFL